MAYPYTQHNSLRIYDSMIATWVNSLPVDYGDIAGKLQTDRGILWVYASPTKALAAMRDVLIRKGWVTPGDVGADAMVADDWINVPLPFASIERQDPVIDSMRAVSPAFKFRKFIRDDGAYHAVEYPRPYDINYTVDYWMRRKFTDAHIREWVAIQLAHIGAGPEELFLTANYGEPWGEKLIPLINFSMTDNSDLEPDDESDRSLRFTLTFTLKGWIFPPVEAATTKMVLRVIVDYCPSRFDDLHEAESVTDQIVNAPYDAVDELLENDPVLFEVSTGVTQTDETFTIPAGGGFIQSVDVPLINEELVLVTGNFALDHAIANGIDVVVQDFNRLPFQQFRFAEGADSATPAFWVVPDDGTNGIRVRFNISEAAELTVNDLQIQTVTYELPDATNLLPDGDMESGTVASWEPQVGSSTLVPDTIEFSTAFAYEGTRSLHVATSAPNQGMERVLTVPKSKLFLIELRLRGTGGMVELCVLDDEEATYEVQSAFVISPQSTWYDYVLVMQPRSDKITLRARQHSGSATDLYIDAVTVREMVLRSDEDVDLVFT